MKNGDISNQMLPVVLVRLEDTLLYEQNTKIKDKIQNIFKGKINNSLIDADKLAYVLRLSRSTNYTVVLGVDSKTKRKNEIAKTYGLTEFEIMPLLDIQQIKFLLESGIVNYYLDENRTRISLLSDYRAMNIDDFRHISGVK